jgi:hypothetical protein
MTTRAASTDVDQRERQQKHGAEHGHEPTRIAVSRFVIRLGYRAGTGMYHSKTCSGMSAG